MEDKKKNYIFVSYKREDGDFVFREIVRLKRTYRVWWDKTNIVGGEDWEKAIRAGLDASVALIVVLSPLAVDSPYVRFEYETALGKNVPVIPLMIEECEIPIPLRKHQVIKTSDPDWYDQLTKALQQIPDLDAAEIHESQARIGSMIGNPDVTFEEMAKDLKGAFPLDRYEMNLIALPMLVTQYAMTYLVGHASDTLKRSSEIQVALQISQQLNSANFPVQVARYIKSREPSMRLHMILVRGPMLLTKHPQHGISMVHGLDNNDENEWRGVVNATFDSIEQYHKDTVRPRMIHVFSIAPAALVGAIGLRANRGMGITLYNFAGADNYRPVYSTPAE